MSTGTLSQISARIAAKGPDAPAGVTGCDYLIIASPDRVAPLRALFERDGARTCVPDSGLPALSPGAALVIEAALCRGIAGAEAVAQRVTVGLAGWPLVILVAGLPEQEFPPDPLARPILLRDPPSRVTLRVLREYLATKTNGVHPVRMHPV